MSLSSLVISITQENHILSVDKVDSWYFFSHISDTHQHFEVFQYFVVLMQDLLQFAQIVFLPSGTAQTLHNNNNIIIHIIIIISFYKFGFADRANYWQ